MISAEIHTYLVAKTKTILSLIARTQKFSPNLYPDVRFECHL